MGKMASPDIVTDICVCDFPLFLLAVVNAMLLNRT